MILGILLLSGGSLWAGRKTYQALKTRTSSGQVKRRLSKADISAVPATNYPANPEIMQANRTLGISSASLGVAAMGFLFQPALAVATVPVVLYLSAPTFQMAYNILRKERRVTAPVLDALRVSVCMVMGYWEIAALDAWLRAVSQKVAAYRQEKYQQRLIELIGVEQAPLWQYIHNTEVAVSPENLAAGDVIVLVDGDFVPADGKILYGSALVDQRLIGGDSELVEKQTGDAVVAATVVQSGRLYVQLDRPVSTKLTADIRTALTQVVSNKSFFQEIGEKSSDRMAPRLLLSFAIALPFLGANRACAFLCAGFGGHMRALGPQAMQEYSAQALQQGILVKNSRGLEAAMLVNTIIIDSRLLVDADMRVQAKEVIHQLRQRRWPIQNVTNHPFSVYLMGVEDEAGTYALAQELGADDYFVEPLEIGRATILERLQVGGRLICYVGDGVEDAIVMEKAVVSISMRGADTIAQDHAQILFCSRSFSALTSLFRLSDRFVAKQGFSLAAPIVMDLVDIGTTLVLHFGLVYSVMFNYGSLLLSAANLRSSEKESSILEANEPDPTEMSEESSQLLLA